MGIGGNWDSRLLSRRGFIGGMGAAALLFGSGMVPGGRALARPRFFDDPFKLGVASGDPLPDGILLWTRLAPDPLAPDGSGGMPPETFGVRYEVAEDDGFRRIVRRGTVEATPEFGHSIHADVRGLRPGREYFYRFKVGPETGPVGRARTAPAVGAAVSAFRFAFVSCQDWQDGYYTAYRHLSEEDLDAVIHLGDYIYENGPSNSGVRRHDGAGEPVTLAQYRNRQALYKTDPDMQAAHAAFPFLATWDDHEVDNDWAGEYPQDPDRQPPAEWERRRAAAFQAYWENMPLRPSLRPVGASLPLYRRFAFGDLAEFSVLDTRQYRSRSEPCGYATGPRCEEVYDPSRTMLGAEQERWLLDGLDRSRARWNVLAQQVPLAQMDFAAGEAEGYKLDKWDAYPVERARLLDFLRTRRPSNPVVLTGDLHDNWVADLKSDFDDPGSETVGTEFMGTSISSDGDGAEMSDEGAVGLAENPHLKFHNYRRGYVRCEITPETWRTDFRVLPYVTRPGAPVSTRASFVVENGSPGAQPA